jgi:PilZ domain
MTNKLESRSNRRLDLRRRPKNAAKATCRKGTLDLGANIIVAILDISETGVRLVVKEHLASNQEVAVTLDSPSHQRALRVVGLVAWCVQTHDGNFCVGIRLNKRLPYADVERICVR